MDSRPTLETKYLARCALWNWHDAGTVDITDLEGNVLAHLSEWQTFVFHGADGNFTAEELISSLQTNRPGPAPDDLREQVLTAAQELVNGLKVVELWDRKDDLPSYFELPLKEQDTEGSKISMEADGKNNLKRTEC